MLDNAEFTEIDKLIDFVIAEHGVKETIGILLDCGFAEKELTEVYYFAAEDVEDVLQEQEDC